MFKSEITLLKVLLGEHDYYDDTESNHLVARVDRIIEHPDYVLWLVPVMDFSLLRLKDAVDFDAYPHIRPVCLPFSDADVNTVDIKLSLLSSHVSRNMLGRLLQ